MPADLLLAACFVAVLALIVRDIRKNLRTVYRSQPILSALLDLPADPAEDCRYGR